MIEHLSDGNTTKLTKADNLIQKSAGITTSYPRSSFLIQEIEENLFQYP